MAKTKYVCTVCGYEAGKWFGKCPECSSWNSFEEVAVPDKASGFKTKISSSITPQKIATVKSTSHSRISTGFEEFDRVLGGSFEHQSQGIVPGSVMLLSGDPGIGKSTLLLQLALNLSSPFSVRSSLVSEKNSKLKTENRELRTENKVVLYITGEESEQQVKMRAERIMGEKGLSQSSLLIVSSTDIDAVMEAAQVARPDVLIVDSVQTMASSQLPGFAGSVPQIRYVTSRVVSYAKTNSIPVFLIGHVTKEGIAAGPMMLSHMVDTVLYLEGDQMTGTRILRAYKNRFGDTSEVGIFVMEEGGLKQIQDAEGFFMNKRDEQISGSCITVMMEGSRPLLLEIQALTNPTNMSFPRRVSAGIQDRRLELLLAVIQKHLRLPLDRLDVFVNIVGGLKVTETAVDLAVCMALVSSFKNQPLVNTAAIGEVGLLGELKNVPNLDKRIKEATKFGFPHVLSAKTARTLSEVVKNTV